MLLMFALFFVILLLVCLGGIALVHRLVDSHIGSKHRDAESILQTGTPPEEWLKPFQRRGTLPDDRTVQEKIRKSCSTRLNKLIEYFEKTTLVEDEETRGILLEELSEVRRQWASQQSLGEASARVWTEGGGKPVGEVTRDQRSADVFPRG